MAGDDADFHRRDLFDAIARGDYPSWTLSVQIMPYAEAKGYRFNPFDLTKVWPHKDYPLIKVGRMRLNRNPENFFAQIEQAAFSPGRSEEHTSELQSLMRISYAVFCLKKKNQQLTI